MGNLWRFAALLGFVLSGQMAWAQGEYPKAPRVAVSEFNARASADTAVAGIFTDRLEAAIDHLGGSEIVERRQINQILAEQGFQQSGTCDSVGCLVQVGRLLGVDHMVSGRILIQKNQCLANARMVDVETGKVIATAGHTSKLEQTECLDFASQDLASQLAGKGSLDIPTPWYQSRIFIGATLLVGIPVALLGYLYLSEDPDPETRELNGRVQ